MAAGADSDDTPKYHSMKELFEAPKGVLRYKSDAAFLLHVFWTVPSKKHAEKLLGGLHLCAAATHRDTPCVPTYFFRVSRICSDLLDSGARTVEELPQIIAARKKLKMGVPVPAVEATLRQQNVDPKLLHAEDGTELPEELQSDPVMVELTELYLDEQAFTEHAGSPDYMKGYGTVMEPDLMGKKPSSFWMGSPPKDLVDRVLEPMLQAKHLEASSARIWCPLERSDETVNASVFLSLDVNSPEDGTPTTPPTSFSDNCVLCTSFVHPFRSGTTRILASLPASASITTALESLTDLGVQRGEAHITSFEESTKPSDDLQEKLAKALKSADLDSKISINASPCEGYAVHSKATQIQPKI